MDICLFYILQQVTGLAVQHFTHLCDGTGIDVTAALDLFVCSLTDDVISFADIGGNSLFLHQLQHLIIDNRHSKTSFYFYQYSK